MKIRMIGFAKVAVTLATGWFGMFCEANGTAPRMDRSKLQIGTYYLHPVAQDEAHVKAMKDCGIDFVFGVGADRRETNKGPAMCRLSRLSGHHIAGTFRRL